VWTPGRSGCRIGSALVPMGRCFEMKPGTHGHSEKFWDGEDANYGILMRNGALCATAMRQDNGRRGIDGKDPAPRPLLLLPCPGWVIVKPIRDEII